MRLVPKFLSRRRKKGEESDVDDAAVEADDKDAIPEEERIEIRTRRIRDGDQPIEVKGDVPEEEDVIEEKGASFADAESRQQQALFGAQPRHPKPMTPAREALIQEALANRAKAKKVFDELSPETRERIFSAVLGPDWKARYEDDA